MIDWQRWEDRVGGLVVGGLVPNFVMGVTLSDLSEKAGRLRAIIGLGLLVIFAIVWWVFRRLKVRSIRAMRAQIGVEQLPQEPPRRGLIVLSSPGSRVTAAENAIKAHLQKLEKCWIIAGPGSGPAQPTSRGNADRIKKQYEGIKPNAEFFVEPVDDEHNPEKVFLAVQSIYYKARSLGLTESDVIADYTGGTKSMTAGMALACSAVPGRDAEYMRAADLSEIGTATPKSEAEAIPIKLRFPG
jgi:hypothetical protein